MAIDHWCQYSLFFGHRSLVSLRGGRKPDEASCFIYIDYLRNSLLTMLQRISWIDNAKALGIFLVLLGHHKINPLVVTWIYSFHMPLFFFLSGYLFAPSKYPLFNKFFIKKVRTLIIPYFFFSFASYLFWLLIVHKLSVHGLSLRMDPLKPLISIFYGIGVNGWEQVLDKALWFLLCLFVTEVFFWKLNSFFKRKQLPFVMAGLAVIGYLMGILKFPNLPWSIDVAVTASIFYGAGFLYKDMLNGLLDGRYFAIIFGVSLFLSLGASFVNGSTAINGNHGNFILYYISAFSGIFVLVGLSKMIARNKVFDYVGQNTLVIMGMSGVSFFIIRGVMFLLTRSLISTTAHTPVFFAAVFSFLQIMFLLPIIYLLNRYMPFLIGRK